MGGWFGQAGYPLLAIERANATHLLITVDRFLTDPIPPTWPESSFGYRWHIPFKFKTKSGVKLKWLDDAGDGKQFRVEDNGEFVIANVDAAGFYRVSYDNQILAEIGRFSRLNPSALSAREKASIINDLAAQDRLPEIIQQRAPNIRFRVRRESD